MAEETAPTKRGGIRVPIFVSLLAANIALVALSVATLVALSVREFRKDKEAYVFEVAGQVAEGLSQQVGGALTAEREKLEVLAAVMLGADGQELDSTSRRAIAEAMFARFPEVSRLELTREGDPPVRLYNTALLRKLSFASSEDYESKRKPEIEAPPADPAELAVSSRVFSEDRVGLVLTFTLPGKNPAPPAAPAPAAVAPKGKKGGPKAAPAATPKVPVPVRPIAVRGDVILSGVTEPFLFPGVAELFLVDRAGKVLLHHDTSKLDAGFDGASMPIVTAALAAKMPGSMPFQDGGEAFLGAFSPVSAGKLTVVSRVPEATAYAAGDAVVRKSLAAAGGLLVVMFLVAVVVARRFSTPLVRMAHATERIGRGEFNVSVPVTRRNEIGDLAQSINRMGSELAERDKRLQVQNQALVQSEKLAAFGTLGAGIAHEVKNPLAGIQGFAELAMRKIKPDDPNMRYLQMIQKETKRCTEIIGNLLKFARREKIEFQPIDLNMVVADTYKLVNHNLSLKNVKADLKLDPDLPMMNGSANQLQQVLLNLAINAGDAMPDGGTFVFVTAQHEEEIEVRATDNGSGMPPEVKAKIFDPFFTTKEPGKGTGLGLSVTFGIVKDHQGTVTVDSEPGKGTTFILRFPRLRAAAAAAAAAEVRAPGAPENGVAPAGGAGGAA